MPLSNDTKIAKSFRALINKEYSTLQKKFFEEFGANTINISLDEIWSSAIDLTASNAEAAGIVKKYTDFELAPLQGFNQSGKPLAYYFASGSGFTPGTQINRIQVDPNLLQRNFVSDKYGASYKAILKQNNGTQVPDSDNINWLFDYQTGILSVQNPNSEHQTPYKITVYQYTGEFGVGNISNTGSLITASAALNVLTFEKGNGDEFTVTIDTGSGGNAFPFTGSAEITGSLVITGSLDTTGSVKLALDTSSTAIDNVMMYDSQSGQVFITSSAAIGGSSVIFLGTASGKEPNPDPPQTIESISTLDVDPNKATVQWNPSSGNLKFIFGEPPDPKVLISEDVSSGFKFEKDRFNLEPQTFKIKGTYNKELNTFQTASLSEVQPTAQLLEETTTALPAPNNVLFREFNNVTGSKNNANLSKVVWRFKMDMETLSIIDGSVVNAPTANMSLTLTKTTPTLPILNTNVDEISNFGGQSQLYSGNVIEVGATGSISYTSSYIDPNNGSVNNWRFINMVNSLGTNITPVTISPIGPGNYNISGSININDPSFDIDEVFRFQSSANYDSKNKPNSSGGPTPFIPGDELNDPTMSKTMSSVNNKIFNRTRSVRAACFLPSDITAVTQSLDDLALFTQKGFNTHTYVGFGNNNGLSLTTDVFYYTNTAGNPNNVDIEFCGPGNMRLMIVHDSTYTIQILDATGDDVTTASWTPAATDPSGEYKYYISTGPLIAEIPGQILATPITFKLKTV